jgi:hypothetical protein
MKLAISVSENGVFSLWDGPEHCPQDEALVMLELTMTQKAKFGAAIMDAKEKAEKIRKLKAAEQANL